MLGNIFFPLYLPHLQQDIEQWEDIHFVMHNGEDPFLLKPCTSLLVSFIHQTLQCGDTGTCEVKSQKIVGRDHINPFL